MTPNERKRKNNPANMIFILLSMGAAYGGKKVYDLMKKEEEY